MKNPPSDGLISMNRQACLGVALARQAHELNNYLAIVMAHLEILQEKATPEVMTHVQKAFGGATRMRDLIHATRSPLSPKPGGDSFPLAPAIESIYRFLQCDIKKRATWNGQVPATVRVVGDEAMHRLLLMNALNAALFSIPEGSADQHSIGVSVQAEGTRCEVLVAGSARLDPSQAGLLLGLEICEQLAPALKAELKTNAKSPDPLRVSLTFTCTS